MHMKYRPNAVIATWMNEERTLCHSLQADGRLLVVERDNASEMWNPPTEIGLPTTSTVELEAFLSTIIDTSPVEPFGSSSSGFTRV